MLKSVVIPLEPENKQRITEVFQQI